MASAVASRPAASIEFPAKMAADESSLKTPTRHSFAGIAGQKPLPSLPQSAVVELQPEVAANSRQQQQEDARQSVEDGSDIDMEDAKSPKGSEDSGDVDGDGVEGPDGKSSKKKKGQRFFCSDFPPCNLSFTRSEHLARHIRKHTGERPFQCHCGRRFSRLDNLRQHAQTVHVNEDIPMDSLAANGARFQRQIRTERASAARPAGRSRSSTFTSGVPPPHIAHMAAAAVAGQHRGHSRNLSSSSIASMTSVSTLGGDDYRRAAAPLGFETPRSNRLSLDTYVTSSPAAPTSNGGTGGPYYAAGGGDSPAGYSTPGGFSHAASSPRFSTGIHSPMTNNTSRSSYWNTHKPPHRRLSTSSSTPFQSAHSPDLQSSAQHSPVPSHAPALQRHSHYTPSPGPSGYDSPRDSPATPAAVDSEYRRHTWQPQINTQLRRPRAEPNVLTTSQITDLPRPKPVFPSLEQQQPAAAQNVTRLPGIHTFDQPPPAPSALLGGGARAPSPMHIDGPPTSHPTSVPHHHHHVPTAPHHHHHQRGVSWTASIQKDMTRLDLANEQRPTSWNAAGRAAVPEQGPIAAAAGPPAAAVRGHSRHISEPSITSAPSSGSGASTARKSKRMGWYIQPPSAQQAPKPERPSPDSSDGAPTPITASLGFQPAIVNPANGHIEPHGLGLSHVEEPPKATFMANPSPYHQQPMRAEQRSSLPPRTNERYSNPFGLSRVHEHGPVEHFNRTPPSHHPPQYGPVSLPEDRRGLDALVAAATSDRR